MADLGSLVYWLPTTEFTVTAKRHQKVAAGPEGSHLEPIIEVEVLSSVVADRGRDRCTLSVDARFWETVDVTVTLDDRGIITAINSESTVDYAPAIDLVAKALPIVLAVGGLAVRLESPEENSLEALWASNNKVLSKRLEQLLAQVDRLFNALVDSTASSEQIAATGQALDVVQGQIADIVEARRLWMASQETSVEKILSLSSLELVKVKSLTPSLVIDSIPQPQTSLAAEIGCFLAVEDPNRPGSKANEGAPNAVDHISVREPRPVRIGVYKTGPTIGTWTLEQQSVRSLDVVDELSREASISLDRNGLSLAFHPDMSLKTFGVKKGSSAPAIATSIGGVLDAVAAAQGKAAKGETSEKQDLKIELVKSGRPDELLSVVRRRNSTLV